MVRVTPIDSIFTAERRARGVLPRAVFQAIAGGSERGLTARDNVDAYDELGFAPVVADGPAQRDLATDVLGQTLALPVIMAPTGVHAVHPDGEVAVARAAARAGTLMSLSNVGAFGLDAVLAANPRTLFQINWNGTRPDIAVRIERAQQAGAVGLISTLDWSFSHGPDGGAPSIPATVDWRTLMRHAPDGLRRPQWLARYARSGRFPNLVVPNLAADAAVEPTFSEAYQTWKATPPPSWEDLRWLRDQWDGPFVLKGVMRVEDAKRAVQAGFSAISVSNHGGNNLDGTPASIRVLSPVADAVGHELEVLLDGGIRRGGDVIKALALGARAVMIGRPYLWGLAADGQRGVERVLDILYEGIDSTLLALGRSSVRNVTAEDLVVGDRFTRELGPRPVIGAWIP